MKLILKRTPAFFMIALCIFSMSMLFAHSDNPPKCKSKKEPFAFGPKISVNFSNQRVGSIYNTKFIPGADLGLFFRLSISRLYIQPEISYLVRNINGTVPEIIDGVIHSHTHHIDIPVLAGIKAVNLPFFNLRAFAGPDFCIKIKDEVLHKQFQLGFQTGLGFDIWRFTIDASYSFLGNLVPHVKKAAHNNVFKLGVGFKCF
jgi:hypothetical protein